MTPDRDGIIAFSQRRPRATVLAGGDVCPIHRLEAPLARGDAEAVCGDTLPLFTRADVAAVNLESPLCETKAPIAKCGPNFRVSPQVADGLLAAGIDLAWLANNHIMDHGPRGLAETLAALDARGIRHQGAGTGTVPLSDGRGLASNKTPARKRGRPPLSSLPPADAPVLLDANGVPLAFVNFAEGEFSRLGESGKSVRRKNGSGTVTLKSPTPFSHGVGAAPLDPVANTDLVRRLADQGRVVIASVHSGNEQVLFPAPLIRRRYRELIDAGAAAVLGHHPHVPQGIEVYRDRPIVYSLGNFLFDWPGHEPETDASFLVELGLTRRGVAQLTVHPFAKRPDASVALLRGNRRRSFLGWLRAVSRPLTDEARTQALWEQELIRIFRGRYAHRFAAMSALVAERKADRAVNVPCLYNMFQCEAHHEALTTALRLILERRFAVRADLRRRLDDLMDRLKAFAGSQHRR